jgi:Dehydrogenases with different specificities (related to short-chain alcohol dehydrogenases)
MQKVALITGARRVGFEIARGLLKEGWQLAVVYHTSQEVVEELKKYGEVEGIKADLSDFSSYQKGGGSDGGEVQKGGCPFALGEPLLSHSLGEPEP